MRRKAWLAIAAAAVLLAAAALLWTGKPRSAVSLEDCRSPAEAGMVLQTAEEGLYVLALSSDSPARRAGIRSGDLLLSLNGVRLRSGQELISLMQGGKEKTLKLKRGEYEQELPLDPRD